MITWIEYIPWGLIVNSWSNIAREHAIEARKAAMLAKTRAGGNKGDELSYQAHKDSRWAEFKTQTARNSKKPFGIRGHKKKSIAEMILDHQDAAEAHNSASEKHGIAADEHSRWPNEGLIAEAHMEAAEHHAKAADAHYKEAQRLATQEALKGG
jgi:hypothetical protein